MHWHSFFPNINKIYGVYPYINLPKIISYNFFNLDIFYLRIQVDDNLKFHVKSYKMVSMNCRSKEWNSDFTPSKPMKQPVACFASGVRDFLCVLKGLNSIPVPTQNI